jgi:hypothetical protein
MAYGLIDRCQHEGWVDGGRGAREIEEPSRICAKESNLVNGLVGTGISKFWRAIRRQRN